MNNALATAFKPHLKTIAINTLIFSLIACSSGESALEPESTDSANLPPVEETPDNPVSTPSQLDINLSTIIDNLNLDRPIPVAHLPDISEALPQLGMKLFFSKSLGGDFDSACVSCHHPALGGADQLALPIGVAAVNPDLLGPGRENAQNVPLVARNAPTIFNTGLWDTGLFWDSRVESIGKEPGTNGAISGIRTPDTEFNTIDTQAGANLAAAQARFPVTSVEEMQGEDFENGSNNEAIREHLAARLGDYGVGSDELETNNWLLEFQTAFGVAAEAESLVSFDNIAKALGEYERSMVFIDSPWQRYLGGELDALSDEQKAGAALFFTRVDQGGAGCGACHNGPLLSDGQHHTVAFPQGGPGKGDLNDDDFARERESGEAMDRYRFRTPSLLNVAQTAPYGHAGTYRNLEEVVRHYLDPGRSVRDFFARGGMCSLPQFQTVENCASLYPNNESNSQKALNKLQQEQRDGLSRLQPLRIDNTQVAQLVAFLEALTDPCVLDRNCIGNWIPDNTSSGPDGQQLNAIDMNGELL